MVKGYPIREDSGELKVFHAAQDNDKPPQIPVYHQNSMDQFIERLGNIVKGRLNGFDRIVFNVRSKGNAFLQL